MRDQTLSRRPQKSKIHDERKIIPFEIDVKTSKRSTNQRTKRNKQKSSSNWAINSACAAVIVVGLWFIYYLNWSRIDDQRETFLVTVVIGAVLHFKAKLKSNRKRNWSSQRKRFKDFDIEFQVERFSFSSTSTSIMRSLCKFVSIIFRLVRRLFRVMNVQNIRICLSILFTENLKLPGSILSQGNDGFRKRKRKKIK